MTFKFDVPGKKRKELAQTISAWLAEDMKYQGAPTFAYTIGGVTIAKDGGTTFSEEMSEDTVERLLEHLFDEGFSSEMVEQHESEPIDFSIAVPLESANIDNLKNLLQAKNALIKKALGVPALPLQVTEDTVAFPWFTLPIADEERNAYASFIAALCEMSKRQSRINSTQKEAVNEKYAFRCFLLRLGFIGAQYKEARKVLLRNLTGSSAFRTPEEESHAVSES